MNLSLCLNALPLRGTCTAPPGLPKVAFDLQSWTEASSKWMAPMKEIEETLVLLKPDAILRGLIGEILRRFERAGLQIRDLKRVQYTAARLEQHYAELKIKNHRAYDRNARYLAGQTGFGVVVTGSHAVAKVRQLIGPTEPASAPPGTIRGDYSSDTIALADGQDRGLHNLIHAADSPEAAAREIALWFGPESMDELGNAAH
jgi:nucleoside-diphosphate kinase